MDAAFQQVRRYSLTVLVGHHRVTQRRIIWHFAKLLVRLCLYMIRYEG